MKTITQKINLYTFDELNDDAKQTAKQNLLNDPWYFWGDLDAWASWEIYPHFEETPYGVKWQGAFDFSQGDGCNIYGDFSYNDLRKLANLEPISEDVIITLEANPRYTYSLWPISYGNKIAWQLCENDITPNVEEIEAICDAMDKLCSELRNEGEYLIFEGYLDSSIYEGQLFTENGEYYGTEA